MPRPDFPRTLPEFQRRFGTEGACAKYLYDSRWPGGFRCPACGDWAFYYIPTRRLFQCKRYGHQTSLTAGTVMHRTKVPVCTWFYGAYLTTTQTPGMSALQFARQTGMRYETAYMMLQKLRAGLVNPERTPLRGTVEADETYIGGTRRGPGGRGALNKAIVAGAVEVKGRKAVRVRLRVVPAATTENLTGFLASNVAKRSTVRTDGWRGYLALPDAGFRHYVVGRPQQLPSIHRVFSNLKTWLRGTHHGVSQKHLQAYLNEYTFRFNRRKTPMAAFQTALGIGSRVPAPTYKGIYRGKWRHPNPWG